MNEQVGMATKEEIRIRKQNCWMGYDHRGWLTDWTGYHLCLKHLIQSIRYGWGEGKFRDYWIALKTTKIDL